MIRKKISLMFLLIVSGSMMVIAQDPMPPRELLKNSLIHMLYTESFLDNSPARLQAPAEYQHLNREELKAVQEGLQVSIDALKADFSEEEFTNIINEAAAEWHQRVQPHQLNSNQQQIPGAA